MRTLIALAFATALGVTAAHANEAAQKEAAQVATTETAAPAGPISRSDARTIAKGWIKQNNVRLARVGDVRNSGDNFNVEVLSGDGIRLKTLTIDSKTGQIVN